MDSKKLKAMLRMMGYKRVHKGAQVLYVKAQYPSVAIHNFFTCSINGTLTDTDDAISHIKGMVQDETQEYPDNIYNF